MRISTNQIYENGLSGLLYQQGKVSQLQGQLATGLKVQYASDDPIAFSQIEWMNQRISSTDLLQKNCHNAQNALNLEETVLTECTNNLQRLREIQVQAGNGTLSEAQRQALAIEVKDILAQLMAFGNSKDNDGNFLFSGGQTTTQPFSLNALGQYVYNGDSTQRFQTIATNMMVGINDPGDNIFMRIPQGNGSFTINNPTVPNRGTASLSTGSVINAAAYIPDDYTMSFALNSSGSLVVMIHGATQGEVIPPSGLADDAPLYEEGMSVTFNGMTMQVSGTPEVGDSFSMSSAKNESVFATIQRMIDSLNLPFGTAAEKAAVVTINNQLLSQLDSALNKVSSTIANLGSRLNQISHAEQSNDDLMQISLITLKNLSEIDPIAVATEFNQELISLQAAQQSFVRVQGLSVFNYI